MQRHGVATMMLLGPTESLVIADDSADPALLAADLLIEAEHGTDSTVVLLTDSAALADAVDAELERQLAGLADVRAAAARASLGPNGGCVLVDSLDVAVGIANEFAPEHLQVAVADGDDRRDRRRTGQRRRDPGRPAHPVQRGELRDRLPGVAADVGLRSRVVGDHRRHVPQAHRHRPRRRRRARSHDPVGTRPRRPRGLPRPRRRTSPAPAMT